MHKYKVKLYYIICIFFIHLFIYALIYLSIYLFIYLFIYLLTHLHIHLFIYSFFYLFISIFIYSFVYALIYYFVLVHMDVTRNQNTVCRRSQESSSANDCKTDCQQIFFYSNNIN